MRDYMMKQQKNISENLQDLISQNKWQPVEETTKNLIGYCIFHDDKNNANLHITKTGEWKGHFKCFACGATGKISEVFVDKMSKRKQIFRKTIPVDWVELDKKYRIQTFITGEYTLLERDWNVKSLLKYSIGYDGEAHTFPMRNESGAIIGILRRFPDGHKICIEGSQLGLFLPNIQITMPIVIVEGVSDAAVAAELGYYGIGLPSASFGHSMVGKFLEDWNYSGKILYVADANEAGKKSAERMRKFLTPQFEYSIIQMEKYGDLREYYQNEGKEQTVKLLRGE